jgi:hypothetical protein
LLQGWVLTDTHRDYGSDEALADLRSGATLLVTGDKERTLAAPVKEAIDFQPHPKTVTMAGDYEYFAAQVC